MDSPCLEIRPTCSWRTRTPNWWWALPGRSMPVSRRSDCQNGLHCISFDTLDIIPWILSILLHHPPNPLIHRCLSLHGAQRKRGDERGGHHQGGTVAVATATRHRAEQFGGHYGHHHRAALPGRSAGGRTAGKLTYWDWPRNRKLFIYPPLVDVPFLASFSAWPPEKVYPKTAFILVWKLYFYDS